MLFIVCEETPYSWITWKKEALSHKTFGSKIEFFISDQVRKKLVSHINFDLDKKNFLTFFGPWVEINYVLQHCAYSKAGLKIKCSHTLKSNRISPGVKFYTSLKSLLRELFQRRNFTPGRNLICDGRLKKPNNKEFLEFVIHVEVKI